MNKQIKQLMIAKRRALIDGHGDYVKSALRIPEERTRFKIDLEKLYPFNPTPNENLMHLIGQLEILEILFNTSHFIKINLTDENLTELRDGKTFDRDYNGTDVYIYNSDYVDPSLSRLIKQY